MRKVTLWITLNICAALFKSTDSAGTLEIELIKFSKYSSYCCEAPGCGHCDPYFYLCVTEFNSRDCSMHYISTGKVTDENSFYFKNERLIRHISLPFTKASFGIRMSAFDHDPFDNDFIGTALLNIKNLTATPNGSVGKSKYAYKKLVSSYRFDVEIGVRAYCEVDYYGADCNTFCGNHVNGHYTCDVETGRKICDEGWTDEHCDADIDECRTQNICQNSGTCVNHVGTYSCNCMPGVRGLHCEHVYDHCRFNPCRNKGTCSQDNGEVTCQCPLLWGGARCEVSVNPCQSLPCHNKASCDVIQYWPGYTCTCVNHWKGQHCDVRKDIEFSRDRYMITLNGVIDVTNRKLLDDGLKMLSRDLGKVYVKTLTYDIQIKPGVKVTVVTFYMSRDDGPVKYDEIDSIFTNHTSGEINSYLPLPLYDHKDVFGDESFRWNEILLIVVCVLIFVVCLTVAAIFIVRRRRKRRRRNTKENVQSLSNINYDLIDMSIGDLRNSDVIEPIRGDNPHSDTAQANSSVGDYDWPRQPETGDYANSNPNRRVAINASENARTDSKRHESTDSSHTYQEIIGLADQRLISS